MSFKVENLVVRYGGFTALHGVDLDFSGGSLGLLGPNGAGKSSLIRTLLGFVKPASGRITVLGQSPETHGKQLRRRIGYHPEDDVQLPDLNGVAAVSVCGQLSGLPREDSLQRAHEILYYVGLGEERYRLVKTYSQGMRQRLKLAQALVHDPELLILDEPTNGLDPKGRIDLLALIADLAKVKGIHLVLCSHLLPDVESVCDQVAVLQKGELRRSGPLSDLLSLTRHSFDVRIKGDGPSFSAALVQHGARIAANHRETLRVEIDRTMGTRPIFAAAEQCGCQVRQMSPARQTLGEIFSESIQETTIDADS